MTGNELIQVPFTYPSDRSASFVLMHTMHTPWTTDEYPNLTGLEVPVVLMVNRAEGSIGFPGGMVDSGEDPRHAAVREAREEIGAIVPADELQPHAAYREMGGLIVRSYTYATTYDDLLNMLCNTPKGRHFGAEVTGAFLAHLVEYGEHGWEGGLSRLMQSPAAASVPRELALLGQRLGRH